MVSVRSPQKSAPEEIILYFIFSVFLIGIFYSIAVLQIGAVLFFIYSIYIIYEDFRNHRTGFMEILLILYLLSAVISAVFSVDPAVSFPALMRPVILFSLLPIAYLLQRYGRITPRFTAGIFAFGGGTVALEGIYHHFAGFERTWGFFGGYFTLATLLALSIPVTAVFIFSSSRKIAILSALSLIAQLTALWWTYTRSAFLAVILGFGAGLVYEFFLERRNLLANYSYRIAALLMVPFLIVTFMFMSSDPRINPRAQVRENAAGQMDISSGRSGIIADGIHLLEKDWQGNEWGRLLFGHGLHSRKILFEGPYRSWESDYLEVLINQGAVGLVLMLGLYLGLFMKIYRVVGAEKISRENWLFTGYLISAVAFWIMSFLTLQFQGINGSAYFALLYGLMFLFPGAPAVENK